MSQQLDAYFQNIARVAEQAVAAQDNPPAKPVPVIDAPQDVISSAWNALAVHPLSVLETEYVQVVRDAERRGGNDAQQANDNAFEAMSRFFSLGSSAPSRLLPETLPLIDDRLKDLRAYAELIDVMLAGGAADAYDSLILLVTDAAAAVAAMTDADSLGYAGKGVQQAAAYLGMFDVDADEAARTWAAKNDNRANTQAYADEVKDKLIQPLLSQDNAVASVRGLYNIAPFYLFRLMHRFQGGDQLAPMDLTSKGTASGAATKAMHRRDLLWLTSWHEERVVDLKVRLQALEKQLQAKFQTTDDVLRFFLKGGRAMYTALGQPDQGENDWDTGILINPALPPHDWYDAFAAVNDLVLTFLDQARIAYSSLLRQHADQLNPAKLLSAGLTVSMADSDPNDYSRFGLLADHRAEQASMIATALPMLNGVGVAAPRTRERSVGVNGELIDIGISKRHSVELAEHWHDVRIVDMQGVSRAGVPVPTLPYFVDDFSTIIREALATETADRKLAKRLSRLKAVLDCDDPVLVEKARDMLAVSRAALPDGTAAFGADIDSAANRMKAWVLGTLLTSMPDRWCQPDWVAALDGYLAAQAGNLLNESAVDPIWDQVKASIAATDLASCRTILAVQNAASILSRRLAQDEVTIAQAIGGKDTAQVPLWQGVSGAIEAVLSLNGNADQGLFYLTGGLAGRMQTAQAGQAPNDLLSICVDGRVEIAYRANRVQSAWAFQPLLARLQSILPRAGLSAELIPNGARPAIVVRSSAPIKNLTVAPDRPVLMTVLQEDQGTATARTIDYLNGWPVASSRDLVRMFTARASHSPDFDFRRRRSQCADFLLNDVMGRQIQ